MQVFLFINAQGKHIYNGLFFIINCLFDIGIFRVITCLKLFLIGNHNILYAIQINFCTFSTLVVCMRRLLDKYVRTINICEERDDDVNKLFCASILAINLIKIRVI